MLPCLDGAPESDEMPRMDPGRVPLDVDSLRRTQTANERVFWLASARATILASLFIIVAALAAYHNSLNAPFVYDDRPAILDNDSIQHLWPPWRALAPPADTTVSGRPLLNLSLAVSHALSGREVWGYHAVNLIVHILAGLALFGAVRRTLGQPVLRERWRAAALPLALAAATLWTVHPLQTESVSYLIQRAESLMGLFYLLTLYCVIRGSEARRSGAWYSLAVAACLAGMATKEVMATAPLMVLLYDRTFLASSFRAAWQQRRPLYLALAGTWLELAWLVAATGGNRGGTIGLGIGVAWWDYGLTQFQAIVRYLQLSVWPHPLVFEYGTFWVHRAAEVLPSALVVVVLVAGTALALWRRPAAGFLGAWFLAILAPTSLVPGTTQMIVEHRMYLPLAAVVIGLVLATRAWLGRQAGPAWLALAAGCVLLTVQRNRDYHSAVALWSGTEAKRPDSAIVQNNLGAALLDAGRLPEAIAHLEKALRLDPDNSDTHNNLGIALAKSGDLASAIAHYQRALHLTPDSPGIRNNLAGAELKAGRVQDAIRHYQQSLRFKADPVISRNLGQALAAAGRLPEAIAVDEQALQLDPASPEVHNNLAAVLRRTGRTSDAIAHAEEALRLSPEFPEACNNLGLALADAGRMPEAIGSYESALRLNPTFPEAHNNLGIALYATGRIPEAIAHYQRALRVRPDYPEAHYNLGLALADSGRLPEALAAYEQALRLKPDFPEAHFNLAMVLQGLGRTAEVMAHFEEAVRLKPDFAEAHYNLAIALRAAGRLPEARLHYTEARRLKPSLPEGDF